jgi:hypothetical protein
MDIFHPGFIGARRVNEPCVRLLVAECCPGRGAFHRGFITLGQDMSSPRYPVVVLCSHNHPFFHFGHRALRMALSASLGLAWERVRGTRSWVYPPLSQGQRSSEVSEGILFAPTIGFAGLPSFVLQDLEHFIRRSSLPGKMVVGPGPAPLRFSQPYGCRAFSSRIHRSRAK